MPLFYAFVIPAANQSQRLRAPHHTLGSLRKWRGQVNAKAHLIDLSRHCLHATAQSDDAQIRSGLQKFQEVLVHSAPTVTYRQ